MIVKFQISLQWLHVDGSLSITRFYEPNRLAVPATDDIAYQHSSEKASLRRFVDFHEKSEVKIQWQRYSKSKWLQSKNHKLRIFSSKLKISLSKSSLSKLRLS